MTREKLRAAIFSVLLLMPTILNAAPADQSTLRAKAEEGDAVSQTKLGALLLFFDRHSKKYDQEAVTWFRKAAEQGEPEGEYFLGRMYAEGRGISQDFVEAVKWFKKSADQGDSVAQSVLGMMYYEGKGLEQSYSEAYFWIKLSKTTNSVIAAAGEYAKRQLLPQEVWDVDKRINEWKPTTKIAKSDTVRNP